MEETTEVEYQISADKGISNTWMTSELHTYMWVGKTLRNLVEKRLGCLKKKGGADISIFAIKESRIWNLSSSEELGKYLGIPNNWYNQKLKVNINFTAY